MNCLSTLVCGEEIDAAKHVGVWVYVVVGIGLFGGMFGTLVGLFFLHGKQRDREREKRLQYWREQVIYTSLPSLLLHICPKHESLTFLRPFFAFRTHSDKILCKCAILLAHHSCLYRTVQTATAAEAVRTVHEARCTAGTASRRTSRTYPSYRIRAPRAADSGTRTM